MPKKQVETKQPTFEQSLTELEQIVSALEGGEMSLSESIDCYESGVKNLKGCYELLQHAERRIELVSGVDADGNPVTTAFDEEEDSRSGKRTAGHGKAIKKVRRKRKPEGQVDDTGTLF